MFEFAFMLTLVCMAFEYYIITKLPFVKWLIEKHGIISLVFSLLLSIGIGGLFGAEGLTVMMAGIGSTILMQPIYALMRKGYWEPMLQGFSTGFKMLLLPVIVLGIIVRKFKTARTWGEKTIRFSHK